MMSAQGILHALAGSPAVDGCSVCDERCWICALPMNRGQLVKRWQGSSFTDQNKARYPDGTHVCEPCVWAMSWVQPPGMPPPEPGKKGLNLRLFSHLHDERGYLALNKASKPEILCWLREPKRGAWFAAIADTGQKHVLPWTPVNPDASGKLVRFEERTVTLGDFALVDDMTRMLSGGVTKAEIAAGDYNVRTWREFCPETVRSFEALRGRLRGTAWFELALWLAQRDEEIYGQTRRGKAQGAARQDRNRSARNASDVPRRRRKSARALEASGEPPTDGSPHNSECRGVGDRDAEAPSDRSAKQQALNFDS